MAVNNNLFPPIIDSYMPAFLITEPCKIYFSLSEFNSLEDIKNAQVTVSSQLTNTSLLSPDLYPSQVKIVPIETDTERTTTDRYFVKISSEDIKGGFQINQYYKVQIRFTGKNAQDPPEDKKGIDTWLTDNLNFFSEWSTVCLIRAISSPTLKLNGFNSDPNSITHLESSHVDILGVLTFADAAESETLNNYQLRLYDSNNTLLTDSGLLYSDRYSNPNGLNYTLKYGLIEGNEYRLDVEYTTQNLYTQIVPFKFLVIQSYTDKLEADLKYVIDENNACIGINIKSKESVATLSGNITIRRTSSESNFTI